MAKTKSNKPVKKGSIQIDGNPESHVSTGIPLGTKGNKTVYLCGKIGDFTEKELLILHKQTNGAYTTYLGEEPLDSVIDNYAK